MSNNVLDSNEYNNNLDLYTIIKLLLQSKLKDRQLVILQKYINNVSNHNELDKIFFVNNTTTKNIDKLNAYGFLVEFAKTIEINKFIDYIDISVELLLLKDLIIAETKLYVSNKYKKEILEIEDYLSIANDIANIQLPYGQRVASALLLFALTSKDKNQLLFQNTSIKMEFFDKLEVLTQKYSLNFTSTMQIIIDESINQSIKLTAGASYEERVRQALIPIVEKINGHSHDKKSKAVEYDNTFVYNGKLCGVSAKRTLRERYKQNHDDVDNLEVDYMFAITLGIDLNEEKTNNIIAKNGNYIIVASEQYEQKTYLKNNLKVISSAKLKDGFDRIIK